MNLFLTGNTGDSTTEDYARELFSKYYDKDSDSAMLVAVSYTHLDVYKRQLPHRPQMR